MRTIAEEVDGSYYLDVILTPEEVTELLNGYVIEGMTLVKIKRFYLGLRVGEKWVYKDSKGDVGNATAKR